ncbi:hypothetical protein [Thiocystis violascens]|uniref:hypothetical protein n=1 Tax=Thiocystis violascens TaxID=73141 RepID=UPI0012F688D7|nr:hypothetical protein [Thiocystis violascens]
MATISFSIPDDVKAAFGHEFLGQDRRAIVARLMRQAAEDTAQRRGREEAFRLLTERASSADRSPAKQSSRPARSAVRDGSSSTRASSSNGCFKIMPSPWKATQSS